jgi:hypothetical protein
MFSRPRHSGPQPLVPLVESISGELLDALPPIEDRVDYENLPTPILFLPADGNGFFCFFFL